MGLKLITVPAIEPVSLPEAKLHLRVDIDDDDTAIVGQIMAARRWAEKATWRAFNTQTWELTLDAFPGVTWIQLPWPPLQSVTSVKYTVDAGTEYTYASSNYIVDVDNEPGKIVLKSTSTWPSDTLYPVNGVRIRFVAGYGDDAEDVPEHYRQAILLLLGHWYENREQVVVSGAVPKEVPLGVEALLGIDQYRKY